MSWRRPNRATLSNLLHNPIYAGAYVYGRRPTDPRKKKAGRPSTGRTVAKQSNWEVLIKDKIPAYIPWKIYERNQRQLVMNSSKGIGVPRCGNALLSGIIICGRCGLRMSALYAGDGTKWRYVCHRMASDYGEKACQSLLGNCLDKFIAQKLLAALAPSALTISLKVAEDFKRARQQNLKHWQQRLERAHYEVEKACRQYNAVEPENRLVARTLEKQWEAALSSESNLKRVYEEYISEQPTVLSDTQRNEICKLASDIPRLWSASTTTQAQRKSIARLLIERAIVAIESDTEKVRVEIHWAGGYKTQGMFARPVGKLEQLSYYKDLIAHAASLYGEGKKLIEIADILNQENWQTPKQRGLFSAEIVRSLLIRKGLASPKKKRSDEVKRKAHEVTLRELAEKTRIPEPTLYKYLRTGKLKARRDTTVSHNGVWLIKADASEIKRLLDLRNQPKQWIYQSKVDKVD